MSDEHNKSYDAATRFFVGIPVWIGIAFLVDFLGRQLEGMTGGTNNRMIMTMPSHLIIGYFVFSFVCATTAETCKWRLRLGCFAQLFLLASLLWSVLPEVSHTPSSDIGDYVAKVVLLYLIIFSPWFVVWAKFVLRGQRLTSRGTE